MSLSVRLDGLSPAVNDGPINAAGTLQEAPEGLLAEGLIDRQFIAGDKWPGQSAPCWASHLGPCQKSTAPIVTLTTQHDTNIHTGTV